MIVMKGQPLIHLRLRKPFLSKPPPVETSPLQLSLSVEKNPSKVLKIIQVAVFVVSYVEGSDSNLIAPNRLFEVKKNSVDRK